MTVEIGQEAPDFELTSQEREQVKLSSFRGRPVVLVFYPFTFTGICEAELCAIRDDPRAHAPEGAQILAISCDSTPAQKVWSDQQGFDFPVLSDFWPHGEVARRYGVFNEERGCANRATFVIDADGKVVDAFHTDSLGTPRDVSRYGEAIAKLGVA